MGRDLVNVSRDAARHLSDSSLNTREFQFQQANEHPQRDRLGVRRQQRRGSRRQADCSGKIR